MWRVGRTGWGRWVGAGRSGGTRGESWVERGSGGGVTGRGVGAVGRGGRGAGAAGEGGAGGEVGVVRGSGPPPGRGRAAETTITRGVADPGGEHLGQPAGPAAVADRQQARRPARGPCCGRTRPRPRWPRPRPGRGPRPLQPQQFPHGGRALAPPAERREVMLRRAGPGGLVHARRRPPGAGTRACRGGAADRRGRIVAHPVGVAAPQRGEPGVEPVRGGGRSPAP